MFGTTAKLNKDRGEGTCAGKKNPDDKVLGRGGEVSSGCFEAFNGQFRTVFEAAFV